ncbi:MAG: sigma factor, partial [Burkholderiales bacterium]
MHGNQTDPQFLSWKIPSSDQQRDTTAYRRFLDQLAHRLRAYLKRRLVNMHDHIEDIVQETLLAVHNGRHSYRAEHPLTSWVHAIAKYKLMDFLRLRARGDALNDSLDDCEEIFSNADEEVAEARRDVHVLLAQLPDRQRLPIQ